MPQSLSYPGVYVEEVSSGVHTIAGVATSIGLFIGWARRGPVDAATRIFSFADYERTYGGLDLDSPLGYAVKQFFDNGGTDAYVIRIVRVAAEGITTGLAAPATALNKGTRFTATSPGKWANDYAVRIEYRKDGDAETQKRFKVEVTLGTDPGAPVVESFVNLSLAPADPDFIETAVNKHSRFITVAADTTLLDATSVKLGSETSGDDGEILAPNTADATEKEFEQRVMDLFEETGIAANIDLFNLVCVPGETVPATIQRLQSKCAAQRAFLIVDAPANTGDSAMRDLVDDYVGSDASYSALYYPWVNASDPLQKGAVRAFPPCGFVAGVMARTDARRGVWKAPAGTEAALNGVMGFDQPLNDARNGALNILGVNCLRTMPVYGNLIWGARTLDGDNNRGSEWKYVPVRRMALFLEESLFRGTQWVVFEPNDEPLWAQIRLNVGAFMNSLFRQGAFQGSTPREAYFVKCDRTTTTQDDINRGVVNIHVGFAPLKPAEFVVLHIQQIAGEIAT
jgi:phage tail sheath protein FI